MKKLWILLISSFIGGIIYLSFAPIWEGQEADIGAYLKGKDLSEEVLTLSEDKDLKIKEILNSAPAVLSFWATWCAPCLNEMPRISENAKAIEALGYQVLLVNEDPGQKEKMIPEVEAWLIANQIHVKTGFDLGAKLLNSVGAGVLPFHIGVKNEKIVWAAKGEISWEPSEIKKRFEGN